MAKLISPDEVRNDYGVQTVLSDAALDEVIMTVEREVRAVSGDAMSQVVYRSPGAGLREINLGHPIHEITSIVEDDETLATDNYTIIGDSILLREGAYWKSPIVITYIPKDRFALYAAQRSAVVQLVKLWIAFNGYQSVNAGGASVSGLDYQKAKSAILGNLSSSSDWVLV
jgi:hypothetical protein